jgi:hypothetical protein
LVNAEVTKSAKTQYWKKTITDSETPVQVHFKTTHHLSNESITKELVTGPGARPGSKVTKSKQTSLLRKKKTAAM